MEKSWMTMHYDRDSVIRYNSAELFLLNSA